MTKASILKMPEYFDRYIALAQDIPVIESLELSLSELENGPKDKWKALGDSSYETGKWTVKDIFQHFIDTERVFVYRITAIARGDKQILNPYDHVAFAHMAGASNRSFDGLFEELILLRKSTILMYKSFTNDRLLEMGHGPGGIDYNPLALGFMLAGHQRWHLRQIEKLYFPLV